VPSLEPGTLLTDADRYVEDDEDEEEVDDEEDEDFDEEAEGEEGDEEDEENAVPGKLNLSALDQAFYPSTPKCGIDQSSNLAAHALQPLVFIPLHTG
jgi:hypothetical protein